MITDLVIGIVHAIYSGIVGLLPDMPARPLEFDRVMHLVAWAAWLLPVDEFIEFTPILLGTMGGLALWRGIRLLLPGG